MRHYLFLRFEIRHVQDAIDINNNLLRDGLSGFAARSLTALVIGTDIMSFVTIAFRP